MNDNDVLQAILSKLESLEKGQQETNRRLDSIDERLSNLEGDVDILKEDSGITRNAVNNLLEWAEEAQVQVRIPLFKKAE